MKLITTSLLVLALLAAALGTVAYNVMSRNVKQSGTLTVAQEKMVTETRTVTRDIEQVEMNGPFDLDIVKSDKADLKIEGVDRLLPKVVVQQDGKVLRITTKGMLVIMNQTPKITLSIPSLTVLTQDGSGDSEIKGFSGATITLNLNGSGNLFFSGQYQHVMAQSRSSGNIELELAGSDQADISLSGSGDISVTGKVNRLLANSTGSGDIDAERLIALQTDAISHGSGNLKLYATRQVSVVSTGTATIEIFGNPAKKNISNTGAGDVSVN